MNVSNTPTPSQEASPSADVIEAAQRLAAIIESSDDAIVSKDLQGIVQSWNKGAERIFGYTADEVIGRSITLVIPSELRDQEPAILQRIANGERVERFETVRQRKDGSTFHVSLTISPIRNQAGQIIGASKIARDISDLRQGQERQELLLREMIHRVKNLFAVASGVVALSARTASSTSELAHAVQSRLAALSRAHELILPVHGAASGARTTLADLVHTVLSPYDNSDRRISMKGPPVECGAASATSLALLLHEFATNSLKYGRLAGSDGNVTICWAIKDEKFTLTWSEEAASEVARSDHATGFGTLLVEATARTMAGRIERSWSDTGLTIDFTCPLSRLTS